MLIDLHAHVLPGLDDGPQSMADSIALLRVMEAKGIKTVVAAAHACDGRYNVTRDALLRVHEALVAAVASEGLQIEVLPSMELFLGFDVLAAVRRQGIVGLAGTSCLVVELPPLEFPHYTERALFELMLAGYRPILNHPERNRSIQKDPELMYRLHDRGIRAMVTAASLLGRFGEAAKKLGAEFIRTGVADLIVSDAHDLKGRAPLLPEGLAVAERLGKVDQKAEIDLLTKR